ncbi:chymotrypsin inhibitor-like [Andrena cerasifolii]|uniref:chymotrypsin inhibitor-like n=1 Tax=Andrena cerasifolii TaxID=2819439 RepID=UPI004037768D
MSPYTLILTLLAAVVVVSVAGAGSSSTKKCPSNEVYSWCGKRCEPTCKVPSPNEKTCPELECNPLKAACRCKLNFVRNAQKKCVKVEKCPK